MAQQVFKLLPLQRRTACDSFYIPRLDKTIEFSIGVPEDRDVILDYYTAVAYPLKPVDHALRLSAEQFREYNLKGIEEWLSCPYTILAHCDLEICGLISGILKPSDSHRKRPLKFEEDYGQRFLEYSAPNEPVRFLSCFFSELQSFMPNFLPDDCKEFMRIRGLIVNPYFQGNGLGKHLWKQLLKLAFADGIEWTTATCTSPTSIDIASKFGMHSMFTYKYKDFKINGTQIFDLSALGDSTELQLFVGNLNETKSYFSD